jgi:hypothetical protein
MDATALARKLRSERCSVAAPGSAAGAGAGAGAAVGSSALAPTGRHVDAGAILALHSTEEIGPAGAHPTHPRVRENL